eukprot:4596622-Alexandrium_andersonii.AAC.1
MDHEFRLFRQGADQGSILSLPWQRLRPTLIEWFRDMRLARACSAHVGVTAGFRPDTQVHADAIRLAAPKLRHASLAASQGLWTQNRTKHLDVTRQGCP